MNIKRSVTFLMALLLMVSVTACAAADDGMSAMRSIELNKKNFKELGRVYYSDGKIYCALSGTGVEFTFIGTECSVTVEGDSTASDAMNIDNHARIAIYVNGERVVDEMVNNPTKTYQVFKSVSDESVNVKIVKLSESPMSTLAISDITVNGRDIKPAEDKDHLIEFVGDSITCGYGVDDEDRNHHFSTRTEDVTKTYAYKTAEALDADYSMVSFSGYGIISGYSDGNNKVVEQQVPKYYSKLGYSWSSNGKFVPSDIKWDFKRQPDVIVINLGTNDSSYCRNMADRCAEFQQEYVSFLKDIRKNNPDATIIGALGIMGQELYPYVEAAIKQYSEETGDDNVTYLKFDNQSEADGIAADWHPTEATHSKAAEKLTEKIKEVKGW